MTTPIKIRSDYRTSRDELREALSGAIDKRRPPLGFVLGLLGTLAIALAAVAYSLGYFAGA